MRFRTVLSSFTRAGSALTSYSSGRVCVCVIGVGYVGESLLQQFGRAFDTIGFDICEERIAALQSKYRDREHIRLTSSSADLTRGTHFLIAVPTPLRADHSVNLNHVVSALNLVTSLAKPESTIIIESSVPVGTTRELLGPYQSTFHAGMSPERIDPGRSQPLPEEIPKLVSGLTPQALKLITSLYDTVYQTTVPVSRPEVAEMAKLHENCYRMVNIAYVNEISDACVSHGIDPHEMIQAASTKPFGFQPFHPGLGVGGHCLPVNPWYLFHNNKQLRVLELATKLMAERPRTQARRFHRKCVKLDRIRSRNLNDNPRILVVGLGFKGGQSNIAHSPALAFAQMLADLGCERLAFFDPSIKKDDVAWMEKLDDLYWTPQYVDNKFDGVAWCNQLDSIDSGMLEKLQKALVKNYVW